MSSKNPSITWFSTVNKTKSFYLVLFDKVLMRLTHVPRCIHHKIIVNCLVSTYANRLLTWLICLGGTATLSILLWFVVLRGTHVVHASIVRSIASVSGTLISLVITVALSIIKVLMRPYSKSLSLAGSSRGTLRIRSSFRRTCLYVSASVACCLLLIIFSSCAASTRPRYLVL